MRCTKTKTVSIVVFMCEISHLSVCKDVLKLGQHYQFPNTNVLSDLIIELQEFLENKRSSLILKTCLTEREGRTRDEETKRHGKTEAGANGANAEEEEEEEEERFDDFILFCFLKRS